VSPGDEDWRVLRRLYLKGQFAVRDDSLSYLKNPFIFSRVPECVFCVLVIDALSHAQFGLFKNIPFSQLFGDFVRTFPTLNFVLNAAFSFGHSTYFHASFPPVFSILLLLALPIFSGTFF
jgi:hypothetical protein